MQTVHHALWASSLNVFVAGILAYACGSSATPDSPVQGSAGATAGIAGQPASGGSAGGLSAGAGNVTTGGTGGLVSAGGSSGATSAGGRASGAGGVGAAGGAGGSSGVGGAGGALVNAGGASGSAQGGTVSGGGPGGAGVGGTGSGGIAGTGGIGAASGAGGSSGAAGSSGVAAVRVVGRTAPGANGAVKFSWPGVSINARFTGTQVSMDVNDGNNKNRFTVVVDGGTPKTVTTTSSQSLSLATGLANGAHDLVIWRNTEASPGGTTEFIGLSGFGTDGALLPLAAAPDRRIEVIGDSLSVGAGVEGTSTTCSPNIDAFTNNYQAYGSVAARAVQADLVTIAWSGIGVYVSYGGSAPTMPQRYDYALANDMTAWDFAKYQPHVVVINLGQNDFYNGNPGQAYVTAYVDFVKHVRSKYASANFILIDNYGGEKATAINSVITSLKNGGESKVEMLSFSSVGNNSTACNSHPNTAAQKAWGDLLSARLKTLMSW